MPPALALAQMGGTATSKQLLQWTTRKRLRSAVRRGEVVVLAKDRYGLPGTDDARTASAKLHGVLTHLSAAREWGWEVVRPPVLPQVTVPRKRNVVADRRAGVQLFWRDIDPRHHNGRITSRAWTVIDCARDLPFAEALAVVDSALREGRVERADLTPLVEKLSAKARRQVARVLEAADERAANPFESALRAYALEAGLDVVPQLEVRSHGFICHPDLVDAARKVVVEAEGFEWHGKRKALHRDCRRYTMLALGGWRVIRFSWEDVMFHPEYVRASLRILVDQGPRAQANRPGTAHESG